MAEPKRPQLKRDDDNGKKKAAAAGVAIGGGTGALAAGTKMPEHQHYSKKTRKHIASLPAGEHDIDTKMLMKKPRKLGARKQQRAYVATMAQNRPLESFNSSPVPITRYKDGMIQRDSAHTVMANSMKGRTTRIKVEDADGYRPSRRTGEELVRRAQSKYQQKRLKAHTGLSEKKINNLASTYTEKSKAANTAKRPHGVVEDEIPKGAKKPYGVARALSFAKADTRKRDRNLAAGATGAAGVGTLAATPVRRSANKVDIRDNRISAKDTKKIANPGFRPGNQRAMKVMAANLGHLEDKPTTVVRYKDGKVIPFDGNHRATARVARGDKSIPVKVIDGGERPQISAARNAYHLAGQKIHRARMDRGDFKPNTKAGSKGYSGKHAGQTKAYETIANGSPSRSGARVDPSGLKSINGPSAKALRTRQGLTIAAGTALLGTSAVMSTKDGKKPVSKSSAGLSGFGIEH